MIGEIVLELMNMDYICRIYLSFSSTICAAFIWVPVRLYVQRLSPRSFSLRIFHSFIWVPVEQFVFFHYMALYMQVLSHNELCLMDHAKKCLWYTTRLQLSEMIRVLGSLIFKIIFFITTIWLNWHLPEDLFLIWSAETSSD